MSKRTRRGTKVTCVTAADARYKASQFLIEQNCGGYKLVACAEKSDAWFINYGGICPIHRREHKSNHWYIIVPKSNMPCRFGCHDDAATALETGSASIIGVHKNPLPDYETAYGFEMQHFEHLQNIVRTSKGEKRRDALAACCNYINCFAVQLLDPPCILLHTERFMCMMVDDAYLDSPNPTLNEAWPPQHRTLFKKASCSLDGNTVTEKDGILYLPKKTAVWDRGMFRSESHPKHLAKVAKKT